MKILPFVQGSPEWLAARRDKFNASEAPAMMGASKNTTRTELLRMKTTGADREFSDWFQKYVLEKGHEIERVTRPLAEKIIGEELYPVVGASEEHPDMQASFDGIVMLGNVIWECKQWNEDKAESVRGGEVPVEDKWQVVQQLVVSGADRCLYTVSKDGTEENTVYCWATLREGEKESLVAGWKQFALDMETFIPEKAQAKVVAEKVEGLPALFVQVEGRVVASNMNAFKDAAERFLSRLPKAGELETDQDFANADRAAKDCKDAEDKLQIVKAQAQSQAVSIDEAFRAIDTISEKIRAARLALERVVKAEKENRKSELIKEFKIQFGMHINALCERTGVSVSFNGPNFGDAIKGLKTLDSMRDKLSTALANAKIEANTIADRIERNRKAMGDHGHMFPDFAQVCTKADDDFAALVSARVAAEQQRKAAAEAERKRDQELADAAEQMRLAEQQRAAAQPVTEANQTQIEQPSPSAAVQPIRNDDTGQTMKLGEICAALGFTVTADFLASLGIQPSGTERAAKLYPAAKFPTICRLIQEHIANVLQQSLRRAA